MGDIIWTADLVGRRLVEAFQLLPGRPVMSSARGFRIDGVEVEPFGWPERFLPELRDRRAVMVWASCRAKGDPVDTRVRELGWNTVTTNRRRVAALATIAAGLNRQGSTEGEAPGSS